jgi:hypothetical protein
VADRLLATRAINEAVRIPRTVSEIVCMVVELVIAVFTSAVELRVILIVARNRIRIYDSAVLDPGPSVDYRRRTSGSGPG